MKIHLVYPSDLLPALKAAIIKEGYEIVGSDVTMEQFRDFTALKKIDSELVLMDGFAGTLRKQDVLAWMKDIRVNIPHTRIIVQFSEEMMNDHAFLRQVLELGIYDLHFKNEFDLSDIQTWIEIPKTIADFSTLLTGNESRKKDEKIECVSERRFIQKREVVYKEKIVERIVGTVTIGVGGTQRRTGSTHTAMSMAAYLGKKYPVAYVECGGSNSLEVYKADEPSQYVPGGFRLKGIDAFDTRKKENWVPLSAAEYKYVVFDFGSLEESTEEMEYMRCALRFVTTGASMWDIDRLYQWLKGRMGTYPGQPWNVLVNFADNARFHEMESSLSRKEKRDLKLQFYQVPFHVDPFRPPDHREWLKGVLPRERTGMMAKIRSRFFRSLPGRDKETGVT